MKKKVVIIILTLGLIVIAYGIHVNLKDKAAIGIIGGADGSTAIFIGKNTEVNIEEINAENMQHCGVETELLDSPEFTYLGNGEVTFKVCSKDGENYTQKIAFSVDGEGVNFVAEAIEDSNLESAL